MMKYRVLLNTKTKYLHITTSDVQDDETVELMNVNYDLTFPNSIETSITMCKMFCIGYLLGNTGVKVNNKIEEYQ